MLLAALSLVTATRRARRCTLACPAAAEYRYCCISCRDGLPTRHIINTRVVSRKPVVPGLTLRSKGAPTAGHQGPPAGTVYIFCRRALASRCRRPLSSNVRPRNSHLVQISAFGEISSLLLCTSISLNIMRLLVKSASRTFNNQFVAGASRRFNNLLLVAAETAALAKLSRIGIINSQITRKPTTNPNLVRTRDRGLQFSGNP